MSHRDTIREALEHQRPLVVGAIADPYALRLSPMGCDVVELRLDSLGEDEEILAYAAACPLPLLITARGPEEGGENNLSLEARQAAYQRLLPWASLIDIELCSFEALSDVIGRAKQKDICVVGSFHHFKETPSHEELANRLGKEADLHKFATMVIDESDLDTHRKLLKTHSPLSVMGMGSLGAAARPEMMRMGSILNYGYLGKTPTAPNQWPAAKLKEALAH